MNRAFKFRAWDTEDRKMGYDINLLSSSKSDMAWQTWGEQVCVNPTDERFVVMQFTGLTDRNGKEIYAGDVVRAVHRNDEGGGMYSESDVQGVVRFDTYWGVKFDCRDHTQRTAKTHWSDYEGHTDFVEVEVIGNIYENPNLLSV